MPWAGDTRAVLRAIFHRVQPPTFCEQDAEFESLPFPLSPLGRMI